MVIATRSSRIRRLLPKVLRRLPRKDRQAIETFVWRVRCGRKWGTYALGDVIDRRDAALLPRAPKAAGTARQAEIVLYLAVCRFFSDKALTGALAHVLAHAARAARQGGEWWQILWDRFRLEEREADRLATRWGFAPEVRARAEERERVVLPSIEERERQIFTLVHRRVSTRS